MRASAPGAITVFFALITAMICALLLGILESARVEASRLNMTLAVNSSIDSLFSQYHRDLWEQYRLLGLEYYSSGQLSDEMKEFMQPYMDADNWFPARIEEITISDIVNLTDDNGSVYEENALNYMKYGIAAAIWDMTDIELFDSGLTEGTAVDYVSELYSGHAGEAAEVEKSLEALADLISESEAAVSSAESAAKSYNGNSFISYANKAISVLKKIPDAVSDYEEKADTLAESLEESRELLDRKKDLGEISDSVWQSMDEDISEYESYADEDGARRKQIASLSSASAANISYLEDLIDEVEEIMEYIEDWYENQDDDDDDELDERSLWRPVIRSIASYSSLDMGCSYGIEDKETESQLEAVGTRLKEEILSFVLPDDADISSESMDLDEAPTNTAYSGTSSESVDLLDRVYLAAYTGSVMNYFGRGIYDDENTKGHGGCEQEYVLYGHDNDTDNLTDTVNTLVGLRTGLNLVYLYTDSTKRQEALDLAMIITGAVGLAPLSYVMQFFILSIWALGQAVMDVRHLIAGGRVPFIHTDESFDLTLDGLLRLASGSIEDEDEGTKENGLCYADYLRILLFTGHDSGMDYRCMDIIHINIRKDQSDFSMDYLAVSLNADVSIYAAHLFSALGIVKAFDTHNILTESYNMNISTSYSY